MRGKIILALVLLLVLALGAGYSSDTDFDRTLARAVKPYRFGLVRWEVRSIAGWLGQGIGNDARATENGADTVLRYVELGKRIRALKAASGDGARQVESLERERSALARQVEGVIERQVGEMLQEQVIYHPWYARLPVKSGFPPVNFELQPPPHLLVVSPRDRIETIESILLKSDLETVSMKEIEAEIDGQDVSSLVVKLGGFGTFPAIVSGDAGLEYAVETAVHEWVHQYLAFRPLGFRYLLHAAGIRHDPDIVVINETIANLVGKEIGAAIMRRHYSGGEATTPPLAGDGMFDFDREMRDIRKEVDAYLVNGEIKEAEEFMRQKRDFLAAQGYHIRKLNQAYFAFNGQYADTPAFASPIGTELKELRARSASIADFLAIASSITSRDGLKAAVASHQACEVAVAEGK